MISSASESGLIGIFDSKANQALGEEGRGGEGSRARELDEQPMFALTVVKTNLAFVLLASSPLMQFLMMLSRKHLFWCSEHCCINKY